MKLARMKKKSFAWKCKRLKFSGLVGKKLCHSNSGERALDSQFNHLHSSTFEVYHVLELLFC